MEHLHSLPGVKCDTCGQTWSGSRTLPVRLPKKLMGRTELKDVWPISSAELRAQRTDVEVALAEEGHQLTLKPGDHFQPAHVRLPTFPEADFLWPGLGTTVSSRVRKLLTENGVQGVTFCKVTWGKIGERRPILPAPIPRGGEPESLLKQMHTYTGKQVVPECFEMVVTAESKVPPGVVSRGVCDACGREDLDIRKRVLDVRAEQWNGEDVFRLATTLYIIVTDGIKGMLEQARATNLDFVPLPISSA